MLFLDEVCRLPISLYAMSHLEKLIITEILLQRNEGAHQEAWFNLMGCHRAAGEEYRRV